ncbi:MAG: hypothetical protein QM791_13670 [Ferruginibacter sp.]
MVRFYKKGQEKMKKAAVVILSFFITLSSFSQKINGQWRGHFDSRGDIVLTGNNNTEYVLELEINGSVVSGYSYSYFQGRRYYVICSIKGTYTKSTKSIKVIETARIKGNTPPDFIDCLQIHYLTYEKNGNEELLKGRWEEVPEQIGGGCGVGKTTLTRRTLSNELASFGKAKKDSAQKTTALVTKPKKPVTVAKPVAKPKTTPVVKNTPVKPKPVIPKPAVKTQPKQNDVAAKPPAVAPELKEIPKAKVEMAEISKPAEKVAPPSLNFEKRRNDVLKTIEIKNETFKVELYDNGDIDGDTVSLFYNGKLLLAHKRLSDKAISLTLDVKPDNAVNELTMYAENLGEIPPNTALMVVKDGDQRFEVRISSDLKNSGTIHFVHQPKTQ